MKAGGVLITKFGWASVFYVPGTLTLIWAVLWFWVVYDSPAKERVLIGSKLTSYNDLEIPLKHPTISEEEYSYITKDKVKFDEISFKKVGLTVLKLLKEPSVWVYIIVMCGQSYLFFMVRVKFCSFL